MIDAHQHVFWHDRDDAGLIADMDQNGISKAWVLTWEETAQEVAGSFGVFDPRNIGESTTILPFHNVVEACRRYPERFIPGYCPNPLDPYAIDKMAAAIEIHGVKVCGEWKFSILLDDPRCIQLFRFVGSKGLPVIIHLGVPYLPPAGGRYVGNKAWKGGTVHNFERVLQACPNTRFLGHGPGFWRELDGDADHRPASYLAPPLKPGGRLPLLLGKYPNLFADLSATSALRALMADASYARELILEFRTRCVFARDQYGDGLIKFLSSLRLPDDVMEQVGTTNAQQLLAAV